MKDSLDFLQNYCEEVPDDSISEPEFVAHDALNILRTDVICHHGVLGMKWGVRRYQNKDGSLTAAGKKRYYTNYDWSAKSLTKKGKKALQDKTGAWKDTPAGRVAKAYDEAKDAEDRRKHEEFLKEYRETQKRAEQYLKEVDFLDTDWRNADKPGMKGRLNKSADLGLRALEIVDNSKQNDKAFINSTANNPLEKTTVIDSMGFADPTPTERALKSAKDWFLYEDQTIGYATIADLVNQGYTKEKVKDISTSMQTIQDDGANEEAEHIAFEMGQYNDTPFNYADKFLDACYLIKDAQKNKRIH